MALVNLILPGILLLAVLLFILYLVYLFNRLFRFRNASEANLGQIQVAMKKRLDMLEQLLGAVRSYAVYERGVFENVARMRATIMEAGVKGLGDIDRESRSLLGSLTAVAENYPELKANETVSALMAAIVSLEEEIARHRYTYNNIVQEYNTMLDTIPSNIVGGLAGLEKLGYLRFEEEIEKAPVLEGITRNE